MELSNHAKPAHTLVFSRLSWELEENFVVLKSAIFDSLNNKSSYLVAHKWQRGREQKREKNINPLMTQQEQMLTAAQNELSHAPLTHLYVTSVTCCQQSSCLSSRQEMVTTRTGTTGACCCPSQQIQTYYWHWWYILLLIWVVDRTTSFWWHHRLNYDLLIKSPFSSRKSLIMWFEFDTVERRKGNLFTERIAVLTEREDLGFNRH